MMSLSNNIILNKIARQKYPEIEVDNSTLYSWIFILAAFLLVFLTFLIVSIRRSSLRKQELEKMRLEWLDTFHAGQEDLINWNEDIVLQAEFLPYKSEFEFPLQNLLIGTELGSGEFGVVHKAIAHGLGQEENEQEVAVKLLKNSKLSEIKAFADELKIMMFLQKVNKESHMNIINLLGSITVDIKKGEIYAIMELCKYGSLKDYIVRNAKRFMNLIDFGQEETNNTIDMRGDIAGYTYAICYYFLL